jgi:hypothetical protein
VAVIEDRDDEVFAEIFDADGKRTRTETLDLTRKTTTRVQGG